MISNEIAVAIANMAIFCEFCSPELLDEDTAIQAMEQLGSDLHALDENSRRELANSLRLIATRYEGETREFVENMPDAFGIE